MGTWGTACLRPGTPCTRCGVVALRSWEEPGAGARSAGKGWVLGRPVAVTWQVAVTRPGRWVPVSLGPASSSASLGATLREEAE